MFLFISHASAQHIARKEFDTSFIGILDDRTMRSTIKKDKSSFVFFHADHQRLSDSAYLSYASVASDYKEKAKFYVVPASVGADVARTYNVVGYPYLMHFRYGTKTGVHLGYYSKDSIRRFISNHTSNQALIMEPSENMIEEIAEKFPDAVAIALVVSKNDTEFGKVATDLIDELAPHMPFVQITDEEKAKEFGLKAPSLNVLRTSDRQSVEYSGDITVDDMFVWVMHSSLPKFRTLEPAKLFSHDGVSKDAIIAFTKNGGTDETFFALGNAANNAPWVDCYHSDINEMPALARLLDAKENTMCYAKVNYTHMSYAILPVSDKEGLTKFIMDKLEMKTIPVPQDMYGDVRFVVESSFENMLEKEVPFVMMFGSAFCSKCKALKEAFFDAAHAIRRSNGKSKFAYWDVTEATPSFQREHDISVPSVYLFTSSNISEAQQYSGPRDFLSIIEWYDTSVGNANEADSILRKELNPEFDEI